MIKLNAPRKYACNGCAERSPRNVCAFQEKSQFQLTVEKYSEKRAKSHELYIRVCMTSTNKVQIPVNDAWQRTPAVHCVSWVHLTKCWYLVDETAEERVTLI